MSCSYMVKLIDYFRAVRAMNETLKQNRLLSEHGNDRLFTNNLDDKDNGSDLQKNVCFFFLVLLFLSLA